jgi:hypothetical protein
MTDERYKPGTMGCHEALHMASFLTDTVYEQLVQHPAVKRNAEWLQFANDAVTALSDLYQAIGKEHLRD